MLVAEASTEASGQRSGSWIDGALERLRRTRAETRPRSLNEVSSTLEDAAAAGASRLIRRYLTLHGGGAMAYSTLQPGLSFHLVDGLGYLAYIPLKRSLLAPRGLNVVIGDPIAATANYEDLLDDYLRTHRTPVAFVHVSEPFAEMLSRKGHPVNEMGAEWKIDLKDFDPKLPGKKFSNLRRWRNTARKGGVSVFEASIASLDRDELEAVSAEWLARKGGTQYIGMNRPMAFEDEKDVRCFFAYHRDKLVSVAVFDPMYRDGEIYGYYHNICRTHSEAPHGTSDLIILEAIEKFVDEGVEQVSLGLSPLADLEDGKFEHSSMLRRLFSFMYRRCAFIYPFEGNYFHKDKYRGRTEKMYVASIPGLSLPRVLGIFKALQII